MQVPTTGIFALNSIATPDGANSHIRITASIYEEWLNIPICRQEAYISQAFQHEAWALLNSLPVTCQNIMKKQLGKLHSVCLMSQIIS